MQTILGHYRVIEQVGSGGMGVVYLAHDEHLDRNVALKVLGADHLDDDARRRLRHEARALSKLNHPNIATIHDFDTFGDVDVLVMEYIPGHDLDELVRDGPMTEAEIIRLGKELLSALETAHQQGVVHRDLKPGNIRVTPDGRLKVLDFGIARALQLDPDETTASTTDPLFVGTLPYMAPEQVRGRAADRRSDTYAAGAVLYEMATGTRVYAGLTGTRLLSGVLEDEPVSARALNPRISAALERILCKALDKNPELRYQSARELRVDLERLEAPHATPAPRRSMARYTLLTVALFLALAAAGWRWLTADPGFLGQLLVADFEDRTGEPVLAKTIRESLAVKLQQSRSLQVVSREQTVDALRRMARNADTALDIETAAELCVRDGIPLLLAGTVFRAGDETRIAVSGVDPRTRATSFTETENFREDSELFDALDRLASRIRRQLGESLIGIARSDEPLAAVTTRSTAASKLYTRARELYAANQADAALPLLEEALQIDPEFAMAHRLISRVYETTGNFARARHHIERAYQLRAHLTEKERYHVEASYFKGAGDYDKAVSTLTAATSLFPADGELRYELALAYRDSNQTVRAVEQLQAILDTAPLTTAAFSDLLLLRARANQYDAAREVYRKARERNVGGAKLEWGRAMVLLGEGQTDEARTVLKTVGGVYAGTARLYLVVADILDGKLRSAAQQLEVDLLLDNSERNDLAEFTRRTLLARLFLLQGERAKAQAQVDTMVAKLARQPLNSWQHERLVTGALLAELGNLPRARLLLRQLEQAPSSAFAQHCYQSLAGEIALAESRPDAAVVAFSTALAQYPLTMTVQRLARAYETQGDWRRAREQWARVVASKGEALREHLAAEWLMAHLHLARTSRALGDAAAARTHYDKFLELWNDGDRLPIVDAAAAEGRELPSNR